SASPVSTWAEIEPAAPNAMRQNCRRAVAVRALLRINESAKLLVSSSFASSSTSRPLTIAPAGLIRSWHTREHSSAARSSGSSVTDMKEFSAAAARWIRVPTQGVVAARAGDTRAARRCQGEKGSCVRRESQALRTIDASLVEALTDLVARAAAAILAIAPAALDTRLKADKSPVTAADEAADAAIAEGLGHLLPWIAGVSEGRRCRTTA